MTDHLELSEDTRDEVADELQEVDPAAAEVDVENPGFASLLTLLQEAQAGTPDLPSLAVYLESLSAVLEEARDRLAGCVVEETVRPQAEVAIAATAALLDRLDVVLCASWAYLQHDDDDELQLASDGLAALLADAQAAFAAFRGSR